MTDKKFEEDLPSMVADTDRPRASRSSSPRSTPSAESSTGSGSSGSSPMLWMVVVISLLLAVAGVAGASWLHQQGKKQQLLLDSAEKRIADLEGRLSATGENMNESAAALQVKVNELSKKTKELWEQMDKLWASAWRRNQEELGKLTKQVEGQQKTVDAQRSLVKSLEKTIQSDKTMQQGLSKQVGAMQSSVDELQASLLVFEAGLSDQEAQLLEIKGVAVDTDDYRKNIETRLSDLERWIDSINASRKQVNESLVDLEVRTQKLGKELEALNNGGGADEGIQIGAP